MPIEHSRGSTVITGDSINYFQLCVQKTAVDLECRGMKMSRGRVVWKRLRDHYQIPGKSRRRANKHDVLAWLEAKVAELRPQQEHVHEEAGRKVRTVAGIEVY